MIRKLPHCSPRGWPAMLSSPALGRPSGSEGDRAAAPGGWLGDRLESALPGRAITYDRVEDGQQLAGDRDDGDLLGLAGCDEALEKGLEHGVGPTASPSGSSWRGKRRDGYPFGARVLRPR